MKHSLGDFNRSEEAADDVIELMQRHGLTPEDETFAYDLMHLLIRWHTLGRTDFAKYLLGE